MPTLERTVSAGYLNTLIERPLGAVNYSYNATDMSILDRARLDAQIAIDEHLTNVPNEPPPSTTSRQYTDITWSNLAQNLYYQHVSRDEDTLSSILPDILRECDVPREFKIQFLNKVMDKLPNLFNGTSRNLYVERSYTEPPTSDECTLNPFDGCTCAPETDERW
jgi:hypothetical protein